MRVVRAMSFVAAILLLHTTQGAAQQGFDAVVAFARYRLGATYASGAFRQHPSLQRSFQDTVFSGAMPIGYTMKDVDTTGSGWTVWADFNRQHDGRSVLIRLTGQREVPGGDVRSFDQYVDWVESVHGTSMGERVKDGELHVSWPWTAEDGYTLHAAYMFGQEQKLYQLLSLRR